MNDQQLLNTIKSIMEIGRYSDKQKIYLIVRELASEGYAISTEKTLAIEH